MDAIERLEIAEAIRNIKATYWFAVDTKDWTLFASTLTEDSILDMRADQARMFGQDYRNLPSVEEAIANGDPAVIVGAATIVEGTRTTAQDWMTFHLGGAPIITVTGSDTAKAIWPFSDYLDSGTHSLKGYGHYHDEYRKVGDRWLISYVSFLKVRTDGTHPAWQAE